MESQGDVDARRKHARRWWALAVLSLSLLIIIIDETIVTLGLPTLQRELGASSRDVQWVLDAYLLAFAGLLLTMGALGDRFGRRRCLQVGLILFGGASVVAAFATTSWQLIGARGVMGVGAALVMPSTLSIIIDVFAVDERVKAIGIWAGVAHLGIPLGPVLGGWLLGKFWWGSVFIVNVPIVVVALIGGLLVLPESKATKPPPPDLLGMLLSMTALCSLVYAIIELPWAGWRSLSVATSAAIGVASAAGYVVWARRVEHPMLDLRLFSSPRLAWGTISITLATFVLAGLSVSLTQHLQLVRGHTPLQAGLRFLPLVLGFALAAPLAQNLVRTAGIGRSIASGLGVVSVMLVAGSRVDEHTSYALLGVGMFVTGMAMGVAVVSSTEAVIGAFPNTQTGLASAINDFSRQGGAALGIGVLGSVTNSLYASRFDALVHDDAFGSAETRQSLASAIRWADALGGESGLRVRTVSIAAFTSAFSVTLVISAFLVALCGAAVLVKHPR